MFHKNLSSTRRKFGKSLTAIALSSTVFGVAVSGCSRPAPEASNASNVSTGAGAAPVNGPQMKVRSSTVGAASAEGASAAETNGPALVALYQRLAKDMHGFETGNPASPNLVYSIIDPMCPHCGNLWMQSRSLVDSVRFVWLPVPMLGNNSFVNGALIMASVNPADAMNVHEYKLLNHLPPMTPVPEQIEAGRAKMEHNGKVAKEIRLDSVPLIMVKRASGEVVMTVGGIGAPEILQLIGQAPVTLTQPGLQSNAKPG